MQVKISDVIIPAFHEFWTETHQHGHLKYVCKGGRGSAKSTHIALRMIMDIMRFPITGLCVRKVGNTLSESVYEQLKEAIEYLNVGAYWQAKISPMQLVYLPRGNKIIFRGGDDPLKIKSIKVAKFPITRLWIEELPEFKTEEEVSTIENSILRAELPEDLYYQFYYSYNPPKRKQNWVNKKFETSVQPTNTWIGHTTYLQNPFISKAFIEEAEEVKARSKIKYDWEYLGKAIGSGLVPFENLSIRKIADAEIDAFDNIRQGIDWGYGVDPFCFVRLHYDKTRRRIYIYDQIYGVKKKNRIAAAEIKARGYHSTMTTADSAEPKSIDDLKERGLRIKGAKKGPGSVEYGEKWLNDELVEIIIDPDRCPDITREFEGIDYKTDRDGNLLPELDDKDNHSVDAVRYALEDDMKKHTAKSVNVMM